MALVKIDDDICVINADSKWLDQVRITNNTLDNGAMLIIDGLKEFLDAQEESIQLNETSCKKLFFTVKKIIDNASEYDSIRDALMSGVISVKNLDKEKAKKFFQTEKENQRKEKLEKEQLEKEKRRKEKEEREKYVEEQKLISFKEVSKRKEQQKKGHSKIVRITNRPIDEMREFCKTHTVPEIMEKYKFSGSIVCKNFLKYHHLTWVSQEIGRPRSYDINKMKELAKTLNLTEMAKVYNVTPATMTRTLKRYDVTCQRYKKTQE